MRNDQRMPLTWHACVAGVLFALNVPVALLLTVVLAFPVVAYGFDDESTRTHAPPALLVFLLAAAFTVVFPVAATLVAGVRTRVAAVACCVIAGLAIFGVAGLTAFVLHYVDERVLIVAGCMIVANLVALLLSFETLRRPRPDPFADLPLPRQSFSPRLPAEPFAASPGRSGEWPETGNQAVTRQPVD